MRYAIQSLRKTKTLDGNNWGRFALYLLVDRTIPYIQKVLPEAYLRNFISNHPLRNIAIQNPLGKFIVTPSNDSIWKSSMSYEPVERNWPKEINGKNLFIDVGANIGLYSILAVGQYGYDNSIAFEANPETAERLKKNLALNKLDSKVEVVDSALGDTAKELVLSNNNWHSGADKIVDEKKENENINYLQISAITFDHFVKSRKINTDEISCIKIDVEGFEYNVLLGMKETLKNVALGTGLIIEIWKNNDRYTKTKELLKSLGFKLYKKNVNNFFYIKRETL